MGRCFFILVLFTVLIVDAEEDLLFPDVNQPCRPEDGFVTCKNSNFMKLEPTLPNMGNNGMCFDKYSGQLICGTKFNCTDNEIDCTVFITKSKLCVERDSISSYCAPPYTASLLRCHPDEFQCKISKKCIPRSLVRNGVITDCSSDPFSEKIIDTSDEEEPLKSCFNTSEFRCHDNSSRCILRDMVMDGKADCFGDSDEITSLDCYNQTEFTCHDNHRCIPRYRINDGFNDCQDGSDENRTQVTCFNETEFSCGDGRCIPRSWVGNSINDCKSGVDESYRFNKCVEGEFRCLDKSRCLPTKYKCDGIINCGDGSDEIEMCNSSNYMRCSGGSFKMLKPLINQNQLQEFPVSGIKSCSDLIFGFKCFVNITNSLYKIVKQLRTVPQQYITNNISICSGKEDDCYNKQNQFTCSRCLDNKTIISKSQICDNFIDCPDLSDECLCSNKLESLCKIMYPTTSLFNDSTQKSVNIICDQKQDLQNGIDEHFCNYKVLNLLTESNSNDTHRPQRYRCSTYNRSAKTEVNVFGVLCNKVVECELKDDECSSQCFDPIISMVSKSPLTLLLDNNVAFYMSTCFSFIQTNASRTNFLMNILMILNENDQTFPSMLVSPTSFSVSSKNLNNLSNEKTIYYLRNSRDNLILQKRTTIENQKNFTLTKLGDFCNVQKYACSWRFYCDSNVIESIDLRKLCDFNIDCSDASDEMSCSTQTHFYCWQGYPRFIESSKHLDGHLDCNDGSDECPTDEFSSPFEMIKDKYLRIFVWFSSIITIAVNLIVIRMHQTKLCKTETKSSISYINTMLLTQLAFSDLIMGVVLLILGIKSQEFSGEYCYHDLEWRSSVGCNVVGVLTVFSSQASMNVLLIITSLRLYLLIYPFKSKQLNMKIILFFSLLLWTLSLLFAMIPVWFEADFAEKYYIEPTPYINSRSVNFSTLEKYFYRSELIPKAYANLSYNLNLPTNFNIDIFKKWFFNSAEGKRYFPHKNIEVKSIFGFYSTSAVCFPDLYTNTSNSHFAFSLIMITYNAISLSFIFATYCLIFYRTKQSFKKFNRQRSNRGQIGKLKRRVFYIILTDMLCWLPIIVMSFMSYNQFEITGIIVPISVIILLPVNSAINPIIYSRLDKSVVILYRKVSTIRRK